MAWLIPALQHSVMYTCATVATAPTYAFSVQFMSKASNSIAVIWVIFQRHIILIFHHIYSLNSSEWSSTHLNSNYWYRLIMFFFLIFKWPQGFYCCFTTFCKGRREDWRKLIFTSFACCKCKWNRSEWEESAKSFIAILPIYLLWCGDTYYNWQYDMGNMDRICCSLQLWNWYKQSLKVHSVHMFISGVRNFPRNGLEEESPSR